MSFYVPDVPPEVIAISSGGFFIVFTFVKKRLYLYYMDLFSITKDYFKYPVEDREQLLITIIMETLDTIQLEGIDPITMRNIFDKSIDKSNEKEYYEVSEVLTIVRNELEKINYGYGL